MYFVVYIAFLFAVCNGQDAVEKNEMCKSRNGYHIVDDSCDAYYECRDYRATKKFCPDGLNYTPKTWPMLPCSYPTDAPCTSGGVSQPAKPTAECPRQFGYFLSPLADKNDCSRYRMCAEGRAYEMQCPYGLAFDVATAQCDWPELVPTCHSEEYLGFTCPPAEYDTNGNPLVTNHRFEGYCHLFFSCQSGHVRLLSCDPGFAFDKTTSICVNAELVKCDEAENNL